MPLINLEYDDKNVSEMDAEAVSSAVREIVSEATGIADVFVYANTAKIKVQVAPIEIFVQMSANKITDADKLITEIKSRLSDWKKSSKFTPNQSHFNSYELEN